MVKFQRSLFTFGKFWFALGLFWHTVGMGWFTFSLVWFAFWMVCFTFECFWLTFGREWLIFSAVWLTFGSVWFNFGRPCHTFWMDWFTFILVYFTFRVVWFTFRCPLLTCHHLKEWLRVGLLRTDRLRQTVVKVWGGAEFLVGVACNCFWAGSGTRRGVWSEPRVCNLELLMNPGDGLGVEPRGFLNPGANEPRGSKL